MNSNNLFDQASQINYFRDYKQVPYSIDLKEEISSELTNQICNKIFYPFQLITHELYKKYYVLKTIPTFYGGYVFNCSVWPLSIQESCFENVVDIGFNQAYCRFYYNINIIKIKEYVLEFIEMAGGKVIKENTMVML